MAALALAACGGDDQGDQPDPAPIDEPAPGPPDADENDAQELDERDTERDRDSGGRYSPGGSESEEPASPPERPERERDRPSTPGVEPPPPGSPQQEFDEACRRGDPRCGV